MKRFSWKLCVGILLFGLLLWAATGFFVTKKEKAIVTYKRYDVPKTGRQVEKIDWYDEAKFWAETIGKVASGIGGTCIALKALFEIFKKKKEK